MKKDSEPKILTTVRERLIAAGLARMSPLARGGEWMRSDVVMLGEAGNTVIVYLLKEIGTSGASRNKTQLGQLRGLVETALNGLENVTISDTPMGTARAFGA